MREAGTTTRKKQQTNKPMSHLTTAEVIITDIDSLEKAVAKLPCPNDWTAYEPKLKFRRGKNRYKWYSGRQDSCDHAIELTLNSGCQYEIGVVANKDGGWNLRWDTALDPLLGRSGEKIMAIYTEEVCRKFAEETGAQMQVTEMDQDTIRIELVQAGG